MRFHRPSRDVVKTMCTPIDPAQTILAKLNGHYASWSALRLSLALVSIFLYLLPLQQIIRLQVHGQRLSLQRSTTPRREQEPAVLSLGGGTLHP